MTEHEEELGFDQSDLDDGGFHEDPRAVDDVDELDTDFEALGEEDLLAEVQGPRTGALVAVEDLVSGFVEFFNARDQIELEALLTDDADLPGLGGDPAGFGEAIEDLWERNPTVTATVGWHDELPMVVLWVRNDRAWWRTDAITVDGDEAGIGFAELMEEPAGLDEVAADEPEGDVEEGSDWEQWEQGVVD